MISVYTGTPGSGKSYHATERIDLALRRGINVICNYNIKTNAHHKGIFIYKKNSELSVDFLINFAMKYHKPKKESQSVVIIDEAHILFNSRGYDMKERLKWLDFLSLTRHIGYDVILITQNDRSIDRQVRGLIEYNFKHRRLSSFGLKGWFLIFICRKKFVYVKYWYVLDEKIESNFFNIKKRVADLYDTFALFQDYADQDNLLIHNSNLQNSKGYI